MKQAISMWLIGAFTKINGAKQSSSLSASSYAAVVFIYIYAVSLCFSRAGVPWIICAEIYSLRVRGLCVSVAICVVTHWLFNFVIARSVPYMISNIKFGTYFVFASFITVSIPFVWFMVPETKGLKLEEMDEIFNGPGMRERRMVRRGDEKEEEDTGAMAQVENV